MLDFIPLANFFLTMLPVFLLALFLALILWLAHKLIIVRHADKGNERLLARQLFMLALTIASIVLVVVVLPVGDSTRNQILTLIGIVLSGIIAFASTSVFSNIMAGFMLRVTKPFDTGDFITIGEYTGRTVERGLLDTEIQTEERRLVSLPNIYVASNPVSVVHKDGAIISSTISIGYEIDRHKVKELLLKALSDTNLEDAFVLIISLDNFSVNYKANGVLKDPKTLISARSELHGNILDCFHQEGIEILSPSYMNQRILANKSKVIAERVYAPSDEQSAVSMEEVVFDKAEQAAVKEEDKEKYNAYIADLESKISGATPEEKSRLKDMINIYREKITKLSDSKPE